MRSLHLVLLPLALCGCTAIQYSAWDPNNPTPVESNALQFQLQDSSITLALSTSSKSQTADPATPPAAPGGAAAGAAGAGVKGGGAVKAAADPGTSTGSPITCIASQVETCFNKVGAVAAMAPAAPGAKIWVASPHDISHLWLTTTSISGTAVSGQTNLYSTVTVKYTNNTPTIITAAATAAAAGLGAGAVPAGLVAGFASFGGAVLPLLSPGPAALPGKLWTKFLCTGNDVDLSQNVPVDPVLSLPLTIAAANARPIAPKSERTTVTTGSCWHNLPNTSALGVASPITIGVPPPAVIPPRQPVAGDGWLYRVVAIDDLPADIDTVDLTDRTQTITATKYFAAKGAQSTFPYSQCRSVQLQIVWWQDLDNAIQPDGSVGALKIIPYYINIADPTYVQVQPVAKGGVVNFKTDCGAQTTLNTDNSWSSTVNSLVTATQTIYKATQASAPTASAATTTPKTAK